MGIFARFAPIFYLAAVLAITVRAECPLDFHVEESTWVYSLGDLTLGNVKDDNGDAWYYDLCGRSEEAVCPQGSAICKSIDGNLENRGSSETMLLTTSPLGSDSGVEVTFGAEVQQKTFKTLVEFVCGEEEKISVSTSADDETLTTLTVVSKKACPQRIQSSATPEWDDDSSSSPQASEATVFFASALVKMIAVVAGASFASILVSICAVLVYRRHQQRKKLRSNLDLVRCNSFQPIIRTSSYPAPSNQQNYDFYVQQQPHLVPIYIPDRVIS
eukprot:TRINITY_DN10296_c0_g1_i1.p1 TRINITY_DN10296_c0_g1~~TRINITY_DN10296_c0_g1_i1.p1  ORF type:complete len:305 (+),score=54.74 TRINITY_DN10296_c0_g1_i1:99-917(+)